MRIWQKIQKWKKKTKVDLSELSSIIDQIKGMTVLELSNLVKLLEDEFGVVAAAHQ